MPMPWTRVIATCALVTAALLPAPAAADGFFVPFYGAAFGGSVDAVDDTRQPATWGACIGSMGGGVLGFEADLAFSPDFFADSDEALIGDNSVTTIMASLLLGLPLGGQTGAGFRPYFAAGVGLIRQRVEGFENLAEFSSNNFGYNFGGGAFIFLTTNFGVRGDLRYFRSFQEDEASFLPMVEPATFNYTRASVGLVFRF
jgi:opacity protein-like surface antigen